MVLTSCEIRPSSTHGLGIFATKNIKSGEMIIQEEALWIVDKVSAMFATFPNLSDHEKVRQNMLKLFHPPVDGSPRERLVFVKDLLSLAGGFKTEDHVSGDLDDYELELTHALREILILNGVCREGDGQRDVAAVYKEASRLNHSCVPNAERTSGGAFGTYYCEVIALKPISPGEEIFVNYANRTATTQTRQNLFQSRWLFTCTCERCSLPEKERQKSDSNRQKIADAIVRMRKCNTQYQQRKPARMTHEAWTNHLATLDRVIIGAQAWQVVERLAPLEGVNDLALFSVIDIVSEAAKRANKLKLETVLVDRMIAATKFYKGSTHELDEELMERREVLDGKARVLAALAGVQW